MARENAMRFIFGDKLSASEHSVGENGEAVANIVIAVSEFGAHLGYFAAVLFADLADHTDFPENCFNGF